MTQSNEARDVMGTVAHMKKKGTLKLFIILLVAGGFLLVIGSFLFTDTEKGATPDTQGAGNSQLIGFFEYKELLEREVESICMSVSGVNKVDAVVFLSDVGGSLYAQNTQSGGSGSDKNEYVIIGSGSNAHALYLGESLPKLSGIGVVCDTGGDASKRNEILVLLSSAYGLPMTRIYVSEGK